MTNASKSQVHTLLRLLPVGAEMLVEGHHCHLPVLLNQLYHLVAVHRDASRGRKRAELTAALARLRRCVDAVTEPTGITPASFSAASNRGA